MGAFLCRLKATVSCANDYEARYHKVEGKPPLLSDEEIKAIARPHIMPTWQIQRILQAQRDADVRFYEQHGRNVR